MKGKEVNFNIITKSLLNQGMADILEQFFKLEDSLDDPDEHIQEWLIIKLVTIIEQFCREIVKKQIDANPDLQLPQELHINVAKLDSAKKISTSSLIASQYNFQNMQTIINELKRYDIDDFLTNVNKNDLMNCLEFDMILYTQYLPHKMYNHWKWDLTQYKIY